ncbi:MAG: metallophosphoesterase [Lachnospiraceae bacterium]|nr:metallophosphoesterase [Lachnospiraceae bacterium]
MKKQIGVIADIHSNFIAFRTAVEYMEKRGITEFFLLGDFVSDTTDTRETLKYLYRLIGRHEVYVLRGNREEYMIGQRQVLRGLSDAPEWICGSASGNLLYTYRLLKEGDLDFFEDLPITFRYEGKGFPDIICCHGSPENSRELLQFEGENTKAWLHRIDADYLLAAHTHYQGELEFEGKHYFNTGSCGIAIGAPGLAQCLILHGTDAEEPEGPAWSAEFLNLPYDVDAVIDAMYEKGLMETGQWFICNNIHILRTGEDYTPELIETAMKLQEEDTGEKADWPHIGEGYFERAAGILGIGDYRIKEG